MERLELLGDSVLKYAVSCSLFLKFPGKHEGKLSSDRIKIIRNATLHSLGTKHGIQVQHHFHLFGFIFSRFYVKFFHQVINTHSKAVFGNIWNYMTRASWTYPHFWSLVFCSKDFIQCHYSLYSKYGHIRGQTASSPLNVSCPCFWNIRILSDTNIMTVRS